MTLTAIQKDWLGKMFEAEVNSAFTNMPPIRRLPKRIGDQLVKKGYAEIVEVTLPGRFPVTITGYALTLLGHVTYCQSVTPDDLDEETRGEFYAEEAR